MITRPIFARKAPPVEVRRQLSDLRTGTAPRMNAPPPHVPLDPSQPADARRR